MNILILGSGGREHAFAKKIKESKHCSKLFIAPGNSGTEKLGKNLEISFNDFPMLKSVVLENKIDMVVVGPEEPLVNGVHDSFLKDPALNHIVIIGPKAAAAQLEGSKDFAKKFMNRHKIPTAKHKTFSKDQINEANKFLESLSPPYVLKADGLAAGKGRVGSWASPVTWTHSWTGRVAPAERARLVRLGQMSGLGRKTRRAGGRGPTPPPNMAPRLAFFSSGRPVLRRMSPPQWRSPRGLES